MAEEALNIHEIPIIIQWTKVREMSCNTMLERVRTKIACSTHRTYARMASGGSSRSCL